MRIPVKKKSASENTDLLALQWRQVGKLQVQNQIIFGYLLPSLKSLIAPSIHNLTSFVTIKQVFVHL